MKNLVGMAIFASVVDAKSFSEAARRLGLSKSMVSKEITKLEKSLGARLLNRTTRNLSVTEIGAAYYEHCARVVQEANEAELLVGRLHTEPQGVLKLTAPVALAPCISHRRCRRFSRNTLRYRSISPSVIVSSILPRKATTFRSASRENCLPTSCHVHWRRSTGWSAPHRNTSKATVCQRRRATSSDITVSSTRMPTQILNGAFAQETRRSLCQYAEISG